MQLIPVILSGGSGTRLWPLSREEYPKQLLALCGDTTMLQSTALRLDASFNGPDIQIEQPLIICNEASRFITQQQLQQVNVHPQGIILEPVGRNTAPALTLAALYALGNDGDPLLLVMPADHVITQLAAFRHAANLALPSAQEGNVVTFGIVPDTPETGYGYIRASDQLSDGLFSIAEFVEKPHLETAEGYLASGRYFWNSGIFMVRASTWIELIGKFRPDILLACQHSFTIATRDHAFIRIPHDAFAKCPSDSIDYAVMEKIACPADGNSRAVVIPMDAGWSDVGAWGALLDIGKKDDNGNVLSENVVAIKSNGSLVMAKSRLVACIGLDNMIVIETPDAVLVASRDHIDHMKDMVSTLKASGRSEPVVHRKVHRPWGNYDSIDSGPRFQVKRIVVNPGASLSMQMHYHRAEHWIVVTGTAQVTRGDEVLILAENQSTYIPLGTPHRLKNPGIVPLEIIEVQSGAYLGEDDIVRFQDYYGREVSTVIE
ncbi:mannose-1-phosphate guanylyltransferase/mannose-6-phosphate isomerase [Sideroxydans sp. CL21]|uniref:mannose-1-phosphate guanylyltransferase/mannose-6-phosphate isomerase n=1 Tax=Sideroxydans sp. CL21 TaxID=2600596 RepID=UPI0012A8FF24|nr:mannose-1-phosphate guanylyltransferase/mannose-6-phosphate isomerase [Sideroxydans sp. CL21]VVC83073.1 Mannose-1-phosphate guanylyltransferase (EC 2.7.7.13) / Mannose-6-phosphate isomerase (EC 5.3.1.8) [Sideroxydans sp. CL21]